MSVPTLSIIFIIMNMLLGVIAQIALCVFFYKKFKCDLVVFGIGCAVMVFFALILEQIVHAVVLASPVGITVQANIWLYALYGGLMAGLFEETGRFAAMKFLLKKQQDNNYNALMYGAGHGGFEAFYIWVFGMINNLWYPIAILLHAFLNIVAVIVNATVISVAVVEAVIWIMAICFVFLAKKVWKKEAAYESERKF